MFAFPPSLTIADPSSPSRVRCAAPTTRRAPDRSGRLCKISPLGRRVSSGKAKTKNKITFYLTYAGILMEGVNTHISAPFDSLHIDSFLAADFGVRNLGLICLPLARIDGIGDRRDETAHLCQLVN